MEDKEVWRPAVGYEGILEVSNHGRVKRLGYIGKRGQRYTEYIIKPSECNGYLFIGTRDKTGKQKSPRVHALVAEAFLGKRPKGKVVNHIDFNKQNNHISNLEYVTHRENIQHSARHARAGNSQLSVEQVQSIRSLVSRDPAMDLGQLSAVSGIPLATIRGILSMRSYIHVPNRDGSAPQPVPYGYGKPLCVEDVEDLKTLGLSIPEIGDFYGVDYSTPYQMLRRAGIWQPNKRSVRGTGARMHKENRVEA